MNKLLLLISCIILTACEKDNEQPEPTVTSAKIWFGGYRDQLMDRILHFPNHCIHAFTFLTPTTVRSMTKSGLKRIAMTGCPALRP